MPPEQSAALKVSESSYFRVSLPDIPEAVAQLLGELCAAGTMPIYLAGVAESSAQVALYAQDRQLAQTALEHYGYPFRTPPVLLVEIQDSLGAFAEMVNRLGGAQVSIESCWCVGREGGQATWALIAYPPKTALAALRR